MTNGNTSYHTNLPVAVIFHQQKSKMEATCTVVRLISEIPTQWRALKSAGVRTIKRASSLVRKCADGVAESTCYDAMVVQIQHDSSRSPKISGN